MATFTTEAITYIGRMRQFSRNDWLVYASWVGLMLGLVFTTAGFIWLGHHNGVYFPGVAYWVPLGAVIFTISIAIDTIGHRTIYKAAIGGGEDLVHHITIFCGITSCLLLCAAYHYPDACFIPAMITTILSFFYSFVDEVFHWRRYINRGSDRVEMWSHVGILIGHGTMMLGWWAWYFKGYPGVPETLRLL